MSGEDEEVGVVHADDLLMGEQLEEWADDVAHEETIGDESVDDEYIEVEGVDDVDAEVVDDSHHYMSITDGVDEDHVIPEPEPDIQLSANYGLLPMKNGRPEFTQNLPDLMSRSLGMPDGTSMYMCFSKKCTRQLACDGYIYNITGNFHMHNYNVWRCANDSCPGTVRTSPSFETIKIRTHHRDTCISDDVQVRLRITVYDLRLLAEFTDIPLEMLYESYLDQVNRENADIAPLFPPFEAIQLTLDHHRKQKIYRKRFEVRKQLALRRQHEQGGQGVGGDMSALLPPLDRAMPFRRTKAFPPSICSECHLEIPSNELAPSHDLLIEHLTYQHERPLVIERYTFPESGLFEQWIRELQLRSRYRLKKLGLFDEHMYYLCASDDRQHRCNHGKSTIINMQCSAFVRVHDWRFILRREIKPVIIDFCLDHTFHSGQSPVPANSQQPFYDYYSPDVFMKELDARRNRTQRLLNNDVNLQRIKRASLVSMGVPVPTQHCQIPVEYSHKPPTRRDDGLHHSVNSTTYSTTGTATGQPEDQQQAAAAQGDDDWPVGVDEYGEPSTAGGGDNGVEGADRTTTTAEQIMNACAGSRQTPVLRKTFAQSTVPRVLKLPDGQRLTSRANFDDRATFEAVQQLEMQCEALKHRMQQCRRADIARKYLSRVTAVLDDVMADPNCAPRAHVPGSSGDAVESPTGSSSSRTVHAPSLAAAPAPRSPPPATTTVRLIRREPAASTLQGVNKTAQPAASTSTGQYMETVPGSGVRQAMFLKRGGNGDMVVVKRIIRKVRKVVQVAEEPVLQSSYSSGSVAPSTDLQENVLEDDYEDDHGDQQQKHHQTVAGHSTVEEGEQVPEVVEEVVVIGESPADRQTPMREHDEEMSISQRRMDESANQQAAVLGTPVSHQPLPENTHQTRSRSKRPPVVSESGSQSASTSSYSTPSPSKRGRGRPRKNPLPS